MYPALCVPGAEADVAEEYGENAGFITGNGYEIRFVLIEWIERLRKLFDK